MPTDVEPAHARAEVRRPSHFAPEAAELIAAQIAPAIAQRGLFRIALSGGNTPRAIHEVLATRTDIPWDRVQITFGDERCVNPEDAASNFRMAQESLLSRVAIPEGNVFRMRGEINPDDAAAEYEGKLRAIAARFGEPIYRHDLVLLGMGEDGHTASLFPGSPALDEETRHAVATIGPKPPPQRITLTFPVLNAARQVFFLTGTKGKEQVLEEVLGGDRRYPAARVQPADGTVTWLVGT